MPKGSCWFYSEAIRGFDSPLRFVVKSAGRSQNTLRTRKGNTIAVSCPAGGAVAGSRCHPRTSHSRYPALSLNPPRQSRVPATSLGSSSEQEQRGVGCLLRCYCLGTVEPCFLSAVTLTGLAWVISSLSKGQSLLSISPLFLVALPGPADKQSGAPTASFRYLACWCALA